MPQVHLSPQMFTLSARGTVAGCHIEPGDIDDATGEVSSRLARSASV